MASGGLYTLRPQRQGKGWIDEMDKDFYVSPFIDMEAHYTVRVQDDPGRIRIAITETERGEPLLSATLVADRRRLTDRSLLRDAVACSAGHPEDHRGHPPARLAHVAPRNSPSDDTPGDPVTTPTLAERLAAPFDPS